MNDTELSWLNVLILGIIEGLTEFLPISSTGHLIVSAHLLELHSDSVKLFEVVIQLGAILAVCWHYRQRLIDLFTDRPFLSSPATRLLFLLFIGFLPSAVLGLLFYGLIKTYLFSIQTVAFALIVGGIIIILIERKERPARFTDINQLGIYDVIVIGLAQSLALFPGVSRAGATIMGGMLWGLNRRAATEFSFLLAIPTMFAAASYDLWKNADLLHADLIFSILGGLLTAFIVALLAIRTLLHYISKYKFTVFGWYRIAFGVMILVFMNQPVLS